MENNLSSNEAQGKKKAILVSLVLTALIALLWTTIRDLPAIDAGPLFSARGAAGALGAEPSFIDALRAGYYRALEVTGIWKD